MLRLLYSRSLCYHNKSLLLSSQPISERQIYLFWLVRDAIHPRSILFKPVHDVTNPTPLSPLPLSAHVSESCISDGSVYGRPVKPFGQIFQFEQKIETGILLWILFLFIYFIDLKIYASTSWLRHSFPNWLTPVEHYRGVSHPHHSVVRRGVPPGTPLNPRLRPGLTPFA